MDVVFVTLAYADVFDYPLTGEELNRWMILGKRKIGNSAEYYFLPGRSRIVKIRKRRARYQDEKWHKARRAAHLLSMIPTIRLIGVTGGLAMNNAAPDDDIDLFIITSRGWLWTTRLLATLFMDVVGFRRHPNDISVANKICLNMFTSDLAVPGRERDLFSAHEVLQMEPLFSRKNVYKMFLRANSWVKSFLPNAWRYRYDY